MTTEDIIILIFCYVDDRRLEVQKHGKASLYPGEGVTIGILFALKGGRFRAFNRWLKRDDKVSFAVCLTEPACNVSCKTIKSGLTVFWRHRVSSRLPIVFQLI